MRTVLAVVFGFAILAHAPPSIDYTIDVLVNIPLGLHPVGRLGADAR
jgi:hypothetical protein